MIRDSTGRRLRPRSRAIGLVLSLFLSACGGATHDLAAPAPSARGTLPAAPAVASTGRAVHLTAPHNVELRGLISPDDRWLARAVTSQLLGPAIAIDDLAHVEATTRLLDVGDVGAMVAFVGSDRLLTFDQTAKEARIVPLDGSPPSKLPCTEKPILAPGGARLVTIDRDGHVVFADPRTLAIAWRDDATAIPANATSLQIGFVSAAIAWIVWDGGVLLVDVDRKKERLAMVDASATHLGPSVAHNGAFFGVSVAKDLDSGWITSLVDPTSSIEIGHRQFSAFAPVVAFAPDASVAAIATEPSRAVVIHLPDGAKTTVKTGINWSSADMTYVVDALAVTDDGRFLCGHPATTMGKYTSCTGVVLADLKRPGPPSKGVSTCVIDGNRAVVLAPSSSAEREGRRALGSSSATYTHACNETASVSHGLQALVTSRTEAKDGDYVDAEVTVLEIASRKVLARFPLGKGPRGMNEILFASFSPRARLLDVTFGDERSLFDLARGVLVPPELVSWTSAPSSSEALLIQGRDHELAVLTLDDGRARIFPDDADYCLRGEVLGPAAGCAPSPR